MMMNLDWNLERYRTRDLLLLRDMELAMLYPQYTIQKNQIIDQMYAIALEQGFTGSREEFLEQYDNLFTNGPIHNGVTFTPSVSNDGVISWTNDGEQTNPDSVDLVAAVIAALPAAEVPQELI